MTHLTRQDLFNLEKYAEIRNEFRSQVMAHKKNRRLALNDHAVIYFEDRMTMQYQIQEMLRIERIFEAEGIQQELEVYNTLIPDGSNWKATFMIEYGNVEERKNALTKLIGLTSRVMKKSMLFAMKTWIAKQKTKLQLCILCDLNLALRWSLVQKLGFPLPSALTILFTKLK